MSLKISFLIICLFKLAIEINGHGWLDEPVARSSAWLYNNKFNNIFTPYYDHTQMNCGGYNVMIQNGLKCGICGEDINIVPKLFEKDGKMYVGEIVQTYAEGQQIKVSVVITANHLGYSEFFICSVDTLSSDATQECLNKKILSDSNNRTKFYITPGYNGPEQTTLVLPSGFNCNHCVLQWRWNTGNRWDTDPVTGQSCVGCGTQEQFYGCSDIRILGKSQTIPPIQSTTSSAVRVPLYGKCGGIGYTGSTNCVNGAYCFKQNDYYSQCVPGINTLTTTTTVPKTQTASTTTIKSTESPNIIVVQNWGQCGGFGYIGSTFCVTGTSCFAKNEYFSQCLTSCPIGWNCLSDTTTKADTSSSTASRTVPIWGQCGGINYKGATSCVTGTTCKIQNEYYSQCLTYCPVNWKCA